MSDLVACIMAGGAGTRFWPLSTSKKPKQFLNLFGSRTLLQQSYDRISCIVSPNHTFVLTSTDFISLVKEQLPEIPSHNIIGEPVRRDTSAAITIASLLARKRFGNVVMAILTSDHLIKPVEVFQKALLSAVREAEKEPCLYTLGIHPTYPATCYGYLELGEKKKMDGEIAHFKLRKFKEKPKLEIAQEYCKSGNYYWNSGMFVWKADTILGEIQRLLPEHYERLSKAVEKDCTADWDTALNQALQPLKKISIDFGVMEKTSLTSCVLAKFDWSDVGGWLALEEYLDKDKNENAFNIPLETINADHNIVFSENRNERVSLIGVKDLVVVRTGQQTLIVHRNQAEKIKELVENLEKKGTI